MNTSRWVAGTTPGQQIPGAVFIVFSPFIIFFGPGS
jgi:hypothetical protein